jgi:hypothetical protein
LSPSSFRSLGRVSVNRSKTCTFCDCDDVVAEGAPQRLLTVCANGRLTRSVNMDSKDGRAADGGGSLSLARAKASVTPAVSGGGIGAGGTGAAADATRTVRSAGTPFTVGTLTVTGGGKGGAPADCATPSVSAVPRCAKYRELNRIVASTLDLADAAGAAVRVVKNRVVGGSRVRKHGRRTSVRIF